jgi:hypothetical protein
MSSFTKAMNALAPNAIWSAKDNKIIEWKSEDIEQPSEEIIKAKVAEFDKEIPLNLLRLKRNKLLAETDYLALSDQTMTAEMTAYRQALRDITNGLSTVADVEAVVFPERPEV